MKNISLSVYTDRSVLMFPLVSMLNSGSRTVNSREHADSTNNATTTPSSASSSKQHHARVAYPYLVFCCGFVLYSSMVRWFVLDLREAYRGCPLPQQAQRPGTADNNLLLASVAVWWRSFCSGVSIHACKRTTCYVSWIRRGLGMVRYF